MRTHLAFFVFGALFLAGDCSSLVYQAAAPNVCPVTQIFDSTTLTCAACTRTTSAANFAASDNKQACECAAGYLGSYETTIAPYSLTCSACPAGSIGSRDASRCLTCGNSTWSPTTLTCQCPSQYILTEKDVAGAFLSNLTCTYCSGYVLTTDPYTCNYCPDERMTWSGLACTCPTLYTKSPDGTLCILSTDYSQTYSGSSAFVVDYNDVTDDGKTTTVVTVQSEVFSRILPVAGTRCTMYKTPEACQALANLCVLQMYDKTSTACALFLSLVSKYGQSGANGIQDWSNGMPWLYYTSNALSVLQAIDVMSTFTFSSTNEAADKGVFHMKYVLAKYALNGTFLGFDDLTDQLQLCDDTTQTKISFLQFGTNLNNTCVLNLLPYVTATDTVFYDMYMVDQGTLYPVPVRVANYRASGTTPNTDTTTTGLALNQLTRRFFVYDNVSGRKGAATAPEIIRIPDKIQLTVTLHLTKENSIYPPVLDIHYTERRSQTILAEKSLSSAWQTTVSGGHPQVHFAAVYTEDLTNFWRVATIMFAITVVAVVLIWLIRVFSWMRRGQSTNVDPQFLLRAIVLLMNTAAHAFFWLVWILAVYWFIFFKWQTSVYVLLPSEKSQFTNFIVLISVAFSFQALSMMDLTYRQCTKDVFFVDWEKPKGQVVPKDGDIRHATPASISVWRTLFMANEWKELLCVRKTSLELTLIVLAFCLSGLGWQYLANEQPTFNDITAGPVNIVLRFAVASTIWLLIQIAQLLWHFGIQTRYLGDPLTNFVDCLSLANISVFTLTEKYAGFYLHGRSINQHADVDMGEMGVLLREEEEPVAPKRGLGNVDDDTTYEVFVTPRFRELYEAAYGTVLTQPPAPRQRLGEANQTSAKRKQSGPTEEQTMAYRKLNLFLCSFLDHTNPLVRYQVGAKNFINRLLRLPPTLPGNPPECVFIKASINKYGDSFLYGCENELLLFNILLYSITDIAFSNQLASILVTFIGERILTTVRAFLGGRNLTRKTLIDPRFLV